MEEDKVFTFRDVKPTPDIYHTYDSSLKGNTPAIVLDHGNISMKFDYRICFTNFSMKSRVLPVSRWVGRGPQSKTNFQKLDG
jgi:hypothetical protein